MLCFVFITHSFGQLSCVPTNLNGKVITVPCGVTCTALKFQVPHLKSSGTYAVTETDYNPLPFVSDLGNELTSLYDDDQYSNVIDLPFPVCFFDSTYTKAVVGSNGIITFDETNADCFNAYAVTQTIPYASFNQCDENGSVAPYYPQAAIMAAYSDFDPRIGPPVSEDASPADRRIEWRLEGTAPCRKFIVSYYHIGVYGNNPCGKATPNTFQIIVYEATGLIDIFFENKACYSTSFGGASILGIQDWDRKQAVTAPGKNATRWEEKGTAYRFTPSGAGSRFIKSELYTFSGSLLNTTTPVDTSTTTDGLLDISFPNFCPGATAAQYIVKTYYSSCSAPAEQLISVDTVTVERGNINAAASTTLSGCAPSGTITATLPAGAATPPLSYVLDGAAPIVSAAFFYTFTGVAAGAHTVIITDALGCSSVLPVVVESSSALQATATATHALCNGASNGAVTVTPQNGLPPFQFAINNGTWQTSNTFTGLAAGNYSVQVRDGSGCVSNLVTVTIAQPLVLITTLSAIQLPLCNGAANGSVTVTASGGTTPYQYAINNGTFQTSNTFTVPAGNHSVTVKDAKGCIKILPDIIVAEPAAVSAVIQTSNASCDGGADGQITISASGGTAGYLYALDGGAYQSSNSFDVAPGSYNISIKDANNCIYQHPTPVIVGLTNNLTYTPLVNPPAICESGFVTLQVVSNAKQYVWSGTPLTINNISGSSITANPITTTLYTVTGTLGRCTYTDDVLVAVNAAPIPNAGTAAEICYGQSTQLNGSGGVVFKWLPATYLSGNVTGAAPQVVKPLSTITYTLNVIDANGCHSLVTDTVTVPVTPPIIVYTIPGDTIAYIGDAFKVTAYSIGTFYNWTSPSGVSGLSNPFIKDPIVTIGDRDITYRVEASTAAGCSGDTTITIKAYKGPEIYVPTGFTPNGDFRNDFLRPFPVGIKTLNYFRVFNRWGQLLYAWNGAPQGPVVFDVLTSSIGWNGTFNGKPAGTGTYVWIAEGITKEGKLITRKGTATLIR